MRAFLSLIAVFYVALALCMVSACNVIGSQTNSDRPGEVPAVTICQLIKDPERFHDKVVRVMAIYENGFEKSYLYDPECKTIERGGQPEVWVGHDKSFVLKGDSDEAKKNKMIAGVGRWSVTAVGHFLRAKEPQRFGHLGCCRYEFDFIRIEKSEKLLNKTQ